MKTIIISLLVMACLSGKAQTSCKDAEYVRLYDSIILNMMNFVYSYDIVMKTPLHNSRIEVTKQDRLNDSLWDVFRNSYTNIEVYTWRMWSLSNKNTCDTLTPAQRKVYGDMNKKISDRHYIECFLAR